MALRSWESQQQQQQPPSRSIFTASSMPTTKPAHWPLRSAGPSIPTTTKRSFSDHASSRFSPLENVLLDAMAWTLALTLWYIPRMEPSSNGNGWLGEGDQEGRLEYREDYGPSFSPWPTSATEGTPRKRGKGDDAKS